MASDSLNDTHSRRPPTHKRILAGAASVLETQSLKTVTVQNILDRADVSRRTFYLHFSNIEAVLLELYTVSTQRLVSGVESAIEGADNPLQQIEGAIDAYLLHQREGGAGLAQLDVEAMRRDSVLASRREATLAVLVELIDRAVTEGTGARVDPLVYLGLVLGIEGMVSSRQRSDGFSALEQERVRAVAVPMFLQVLAATETLPGNSEAEDDGTA